MVPSTRLHVSKILTRHIFFSDEYIHLGPNWLVPCIGSLHNSLLSLGSRQKMAEPLAPMSPRGPHAS